MPRNALVSVENAVAVIEKFFDHFQDGRYPEWSSDIWKQMSNALDQRWSGENVYHNVTKNRRKITETAYSNKNVPFIPFKSKCDKNTFGESMLDTSTRLDDNDSPYSYEEETVGLDYFEVRITPAKWREMREPDTTYSDNRTYPILHRNVWTDTLAIAIDRQLELPCAFIFDKSKIYETQGSLHYMRITGFCKSGRCGNPLYCYLYEEPVGDRNFNIIVRTRDTLHDKHDKVERPLRGIRRQRIGEEVFNEGSTNWHKRQVIENTRFGGRIPSHIPKPNILDQAKKQYVDRKLGIKPSDGKDLIRTIEAMKHSAPYLGFIHEVKRDKFYVSFSTPAQLHAYKQYCRTTKNLSSVCIDGTGSIVLPLIREDGSPSGHIFLYSITINFNGTTVSVFDWLTESQDTDIVFWACKQWQKLGAPKPREVVCDSSRALLNGLSLALNYQTVKVYIETCFLYTSRNSEYRYRSPIYTYLRLDVAHLMIMVRRWKCFDHMRHTVVRQFYQYCIGLMIDCQTLGQFKEIFQLTCIVGVNEFQDSVVEGSGQTVLNSRRKLEEHIAKRNFDLNFESSTHDDDITSEKSEEEDSADSSRTKEYIANLRKTAEVIRHTGSESNLFFFPDFIDRFMSLAYEFPFWTAVAIPHVAEHASSAFVEGHFNIIKNRMLKNYSGRLRVDKFLKLIFNDYSGSAAIATSKLKVFNQIDGPYPSPSMKPNIFLPRQAKKTIQTPESTSLPSKVQNLESCEKESTRNGSTHLKSSPDWRDTGIADVNDNAVEIDDRFMENINIEDFQDRFEESNTDVGSADTPVEIKAIIQNQLKPEIRTAKGKYFKPNPGIQRRNTLATNVQQSGVLRNGNLVANPARIDGACYFAYNTCGFDSPIQILSASAMDDPEYMSFVQKSTNETLQFILNFIEKGPCADIYKQRVVLLKRLFESKIKANYDRCGKLKSYSIDVFGNLHTIWTTCFKSEPSVHYIYQCPRCDIYSSPVSTLSVNHKMIRDQGFVALQEALVFHSQLSCINANCTELCQIELAFNPQIFIELDIRPNLESLTGLTCRLREFPSQLSLNGVQYRLAGVIARLPGHYIAYCRRVNNRWELCNDTKSGIIHSRPNTIIEPHGVIYIISIDHERAVADSSQSFDTSEPKLSRSAATVGMEDNITNNNEEISVSPNRFDRLEFPTTVPLDDSDTTTRDNWRNKEEIKEFCFGPSFDETAEDNISSQEPTLESIRSDYECEPLLMLQSGNIMPGIIIDEDIFHLRGTNNFDSIVHILRCSSLDETPYMDLMKKSANETFRFTLNLIENNSHQDIYLRRAVLLKSLYSEKILHEVENDIALYTIDLSETPTHTWTTCLENEPSVLREYECRSCETYVLPMPVLTVDPNVIARKGFVALQEALYFYKTLKKVKCRQEYCSELCTVTAYPNFHFYIECNVTSSDRSHTRLKCRLQDFPIRLCLKGQPRQYRLRGIVAQTSDHIAAYCLRADDHWELYDSSATMTLNIHPSEAIEPHGAIYTSIA